VHAHPKWSTFLTMVGESSSRCMRRGPGLSGAAPRFAELDQQPGDGGPAGRDARGPAGGADEVARRGDVGNDIVEAFVLANYMEENAYRQYMALQIGKPYSFNEESGPLCREKLWNANLFKRTWAISGRKLG